MGSSGRMEPVPEDIAFAAGQADAGRGDVHEAEGGGIDPSPLGHGRNVKSVELGGCRHLQTAENGLQTFVEASGQAFRAVDLGLARQARRRRHSDVREVRDQDIGRAPLGKAEEQTPQRLYGTVNQLPSGATQPAAIRSLPPP
jgi:hypothetical protein